MPIKSFFMELLLCLVVIKVTVPTPVREHRRFV